MILSLVNVKGGVGKTTTAVNLAAAFARSGLRSLVVDLDPQGSASFSLGLSEENPEPSVADVLLRGRGARECVWDTHIEDLALLPGSMEIAGADVALARRKDPQTILARSLSPLSRSYDAIVIDAPPGLGLLSTSALVASQGYIVPVVPHDLAVEGLARFLSGVDAAQSGSRKKSELLGILPTMVDKRTSLSEEIVTKLRRKYSSQVFKVTIPVNVKLAMAPRYGTTIFDYESWSTGAQAYSRLGGEVLRRARQRGWS